MNATEEMIALAKEIGFDVAAPLDPKTIVLREDVRAMCAEGKCHAYGHNWTCPPACGDLDHCRAMAEKVKELYPGATCLGAGGCTVCKSCAYPEPCRFPEKAFSSMEGYGMLVSDVCTANNVPYYHGENTIAYVGCYLFV